MGFNCCQKDQYYRDANWKPPRDLVIPQNYPLQPWAPLTHGYAPNQAYQVGPGYQQVTPAYVPVVQGCQQPPAYPNWQPYQPVVPPQQFIQAPQAPQMMMPQPAMTVQPPIVRVAQPHYYGPAPSQYLGQANGPFMPRYY